LQFLEKHVAADPLNAYAYLYLSNTQRRAGRFNEALEAIRIAVDLNPAVSDAQVRIGQVLLERGEAAAALAEFERDNDEENRQFGRALAYHALGRKPEADQALSEFATRSSQKSAFYIAEVHAFRGELNQAFEWLDRAYQQREISCTWVKTEPLLKNLWPDPRFKAFLRKMNLPA